MVAESEAVAILRHGSKPALGLAPKDDVRFGWASPFACGESTLSLRRRGWRFHRADGDRDQNFRFSETVAVLPGMA